MPLVEINGKSVDVPADINLIEAAKTVGIEIPHYCYHPALRVVGSCRMCQVEVEQYGRVSLVIGCSTSVAEGMKIFTDTERVHKQRQMVLELLLQNHPLDCPICDDAGECDLQNYYMEYGLHDSRVELAENTASTKSSMQAPRLFWTASDVFSARAACGFCGKLRAQGNWGFLDRA
ncbi:MAG: 2Fe-2S iron-sulfur cluster-binding protein [bacterium]